MTEQINDIIQRKGKERKQNTFAGNPERTENYPLVPPITLESEDQGTTSDARDVQNYEFW